MEEEESEHKVFRSPLSELLELLGRHLELLESAVLPLGALLSLRSTVEMSLLPLRSVGSTELSSLPLLESGETMLEILSFRMMLPLALLETFSETAGLIS